MSNYYIDAMRDGLEMKATEMSTTELAAELGLEVDALSEKPFGDTPGSHQAPNQILFTGYDIFTFDELVDMYITQEFEGLARQSQKGCKGLFRDLKSSPAPKRL